MPPHAVGCGMLYFGCYETDSLVFSARATHAGGRWVYGSIFGGAVAVIVHIDRTGGAIAGSSG